MLDIKQVTVKTNKNYNHMHRILFETFTFLIKIKIFSMMLMALGISCALVCVRSLTFEDYPGMCGKGKKGRNRWCPLVLVTVNLL